METSKQRINTQQESRIYPMIATSVKFKGYRCFKDHWAGFEKFKPINVIIGRNNTGKSHLLDVVEHLAANGPKDKQGWQFQCNGDLDETSLKTVFNSGYSGGGLHGDHWLNHGKLFLNQPINWELVDRDNITNLKLRGEHPIEIGLQTYPPNNATDNIVAARTNALTSLCQRAVAPVTGKMWRRLRAERDLLPETPTHALRLDENGGGATNIIRRFLNSATPTINRDRRYSSYANIYVGAVGSLAGPGADELLFRLLDNSETMGEAATLLIWRAHGFQEPDNRTGRRVPLDVVSERRNWATQARIPEDVALADRIFIALQTQWPDANEAPPRFSVFGLEHIFGALVTLRDFRVVPYLLTIARGQYNAHIAARLLLSLAMKGASIPGREMDAAFENNFFSNANEVEHDISKIFWSKRDALSALLLSDAPDSGLARIRRLPTDWFRSHLIDDLIMLIAECPTSTAMDYLMELARDYGADSGAAYALQNAFLRHPGPRSYIGLLLLLDHALFRASSATYSLVENLGALVRNEPTLLPEIEKRCVSSATPDQRRLLADLLREIGTHAAAMLYLRILSSDREFVMHLETDARAFALTKVPFGNDRNTYSLAAVDTSAWRAALWGIVRTEPTRANVATELLRHVYLLRMEYGWPAGEARHPDVATLTSNSGPWPIPATTLNVR